MCRGMRRAITFRTFTQRAPIDGWEPEASGLAADGLPFGFGYLGLRAPRSTPGYHLTGLQPLVKAGSVVSGT